MYLVGLKNIKKFEKSNVEGKIVGNLDFCLFQSTLSLKMALCPPRIKSKKILVTKKTRIAKKIEIILKFNEMPLNQYFKLFKKYFPIDKPVKLIQINSFSTEIMTNKIQITFILIFRKKLFFAEISSTWLESKKDFYDKIEIID